MKQKGLYQLWLTTSVICIAAATASAQSFQVQCPPSTITHPATVTTMPNLPTQVRRTWTLGPGGYYVPSAKVNGAMKCQQISGGDGYATMGDGTQTTCSLSGRYRGFRTSPMAGPARSSRCLQYRVFGSGATARRPCHDGLSRSPTTAPSGRFPMRTASPTTPLRPPVSLTPHHVPAYLSSCLRELSRQASTATSIPA